MTEYQHCQFISDEPLSDGQLTEIRALTTRARLTRHSFVNTYGWGDFKGGPEELVSSHYDGHLYFANWNTRRVILRWPATDLSLNTARAYCFADSAVSWESGASVLITLESDPEDGAKDFNALFDEQTGRTDSSERWLPSISGARPLVADGDLRLLYLAWLLSLHNGELDDTDLEPPVPPGLADLPEPLADLATFLRIDPDVIAAAAEHSPPPPSRPSITDCEAWIHSLNTAERDRVLAELLHAPGDRALTDLRRRFLEAQPVRGAAHEPRTVGELRALVPARTAREELASHRKEQERRGAEDRRVAVLQHDPEAAWRRVDDLLAIRGTRHYPEVVQLLGDLGVLADREGTSGVFAQRYSRFISVHRTKKALLRDLETQDRLRPAR
ncbi:hypothetical protein [Streptomyces sp. NPDC058622]|uniref:hypothetical protein n=1 Tax=Streptomyces sp. NPDC058622 TaxID=3346562 RepID=UPI00364F4845